MKRWLVPLSLAVAGLVVLGWPRFRAAARPCDAAAYGVLRGALQQAQASGRFPRLTGCLDVDAPGSRSRTTASSLQLQGATAVLQRRVDERADADAVLDYAQALTVAGQPSVALEMLDRRRPGDGARTLLVRAAILTARGIDSGGAQDLIQALDLYGAVLRLRPSDPIALFNQALTLDAIALRHEALAAWERYRSVAPSSSWAPLATGRVEVLRRASVYSRWPAARQAVLAAATGGDSVTIARIASDFPQAVRELVDDEVLPEWADAYTRGDSATADAALVRADVLSRALASLNGDRLALSEVALLHRDLGARAAARLKKHAEGYRAYRSAREMLENDRELDAVASFDRAKTILREADNPLWMWATVHAAYASFNRYTGRELPGAIAELSRLADAAAAAHYPSLEGRLRYIIGSLEGARTNLTKALASNDKSLALFKGIRESEYLAATEVIRSSELLLLGQPDESWTAQADAIAHVDGVISARRRHAILINAAVRAIAQKRFHAALNLLGETLALSADHGNPNRLAEAHLHRARTLTELGEDSGADLDQARSQIDQIPDLALRGRMHAEWLIARGEALSARQGPEAVSTLTEGLRYFEDKTFLSRVVAIRLERGRANVHAGSNDAADADFRAGIATYESYRRSLSREQQRIASVDSVWDLFEDMIELQLDRKKDPSAALDFAERARARTLLELYTGDDRVEPLRPDDLRRSMSASTTMLYFAVLEGRLVTWVLGPDTRALIDRRVDTAALQAAVTDQIGTLQAPHWAQASRGVSERLFDELIRPIGGLVRPGSTLVIVPDGFVNRVAFGALRDKDSGRFLIEDHPIVFAPSANMFVAASDSLRRRAPALESAYIAGDPEGSLPGAGQEAREIAALYRDARIDRGPLATKDRFVASAGRYGVVHFAGHAQSVPLLPFLARLEFAPDPGETSPTPMFADELRRVKFPRTQLVVLAACRTAQGQTRRGEGVLSLARPVLAAGVPSVIGTLWDIDDRTSSRFLVDLHRRLVEGRAAPEALREAQMAALHPPGGGEPASATWAAFVAMGGVR